MKVNFKNNTLIITKAENKAMSNPQSDEFRIVCDYRKAFPELRIVVKETQKKRDTFKGLTVAYMEKYIASKDASKMAEFYTLRGVVDGKKNDFVDTATYGQLKSWFFLNFPEIVELNESVAKITAEVKRQIEIRRAEKEENAIVA